MGNYQFDWAVIADNAWFVAGGIPTTLLVSFGAIVIGALIGAPIGVLLVRSWAPIRWVLTVYVEVFRNTPMLVQIVWLYYVIPVVLGLPMPPIWAGTLAIGLNAGAYLGDMFRGGIIGMPTGQSEAARSLGLSYGQSMSRVILPQTVRRMIPPFSNMFVVIIKESALVSYIGVLDILHRGDVVQVSTFKPLEAYTLVAVFFFIIITTATQLMRVIERKWGRPLD